ncbi:MAG: methyltransferase domain-containing protein, partial [Rhodospirillaceae bacterium]
THQEKLWRGDFGTAYIQRNAVDPKTLALRTRIWAKVLETVAGAPPSSILEVGANIGLNLRALANLTSAELIAVEPNNTARERLVADGVVKDGQALDGVASNIDLPDASVDLAFTCGVLIHIHPDQLLSSCTEIVRVARRYVVCVEYFANKPAEVPYRDQRDALFVRDFGSFYLDNFPNLKVIDYGFFWNRTTGLDDLTWWVFEKRA